MAGKEGTTTMSPLNSSEISRKITKAFCEIHRPEALNQVRSEVEQVIQGLSSGSLRVVHKQDERWVVHEWVKQAILIYFRLRKMEVLRAGDLAFYDKIPLKKWTGEERVRVVPHALVRQGAYVAPHAILMPCYVNIGAYVGEGTLVDTWATVGSCAQVGKGVHLSGGVGLGGVLEPVQARPVIVEDHVFVGSRSIIVEGAIIRRGAVIGAGTVITASTKIIDTTKPDSPVQKGEVPAGAVVISGGMEKKFARGVFTVPCALIIGQRSKSTDLKTSLNQVLREFDIS